jgi:hypothetical protein
MRQLSQRYMIRAGDKASLNKQELVVGFEVFTMMIMKISIFWDLTPCAFALVFCFTYSSTLKMEATFSSKTSVDFQRTTRPYIPEDSTLQE